MASREENSVTPFLYAFKRWFTFMGCSSALPTILTTVQSYELFLKPAIGISLFVIHPAVLLYYIPGKYYTIEVADHRPVIHALQGFCRAAREKKIRMAMVILCIYTIGISLLTNRDFPLGYVNTFLYICSRKRKRYILLNPLNFKRYGTSKIISNGANSNQQSD